MTCCLLTLAVTPARAEDEPGAPDAPAEAEPLLRVGARVRLNRSGRNTTPLIGKVLRLDDQALLLELREGLDPLEVRRADIRRIDVSVGRRPRTMDGARIGGLVLLVPGIVLGAKLTEFGYGLGNHRRAPFGVIARGALSIGLGAGAAGAALGALIGSTHATESWKATDPGRFSAHLAPVKGGVAASLSVRF